VNKIILALDTTNLDEAIDITKKVKNKIFTIKLGLEFFNAHGKEGVKKFNEMGIINLMLDLKLKDIPETVYKAIKALDDIQFGFLTIHGQGGKSMIDKAKKAEELLKKNTHLFSEIENKFKVEKEILLALWGIETHFGKHVGKMDIISSLATLSYDKRRRDFFSSQLLTLLRLIDKKLIDPSKLYGSWAGAYGNFQFMPSSISRYAIDYDGNNKIELKISLADSLASAANYINKIGWEKGQPCFYRVKLTKKVKKKYINLSARKISHKLKISKWKSKGVVNFDGSELKTNLKAALILPDGKPETPTYLVFDNYEKILKWNRSLRFGISVCTLAGMIKT